MNRLPRGAAARGLAAQIAKEAARETGVFCTLRTFAPVAPDAPWETFGSVASEHGERPLFFVSDHGVMRTASVLVCDIAGDRFVTPKGPLLPPELGALVAASARVLDARPTVLDAAIAILDRVHPVGVRLEVLGRWEGVLGARFDHGRVGPLAFVWQRAHALTIAVGARSLAGRLVVPSEERALADVEALRADVPRVVAAIAALVESGRDGATERA